MLVFGSALYGSAESVQDGDILKAGTNISVTKDETTKTITISTDGVATSVEVDAVKKDVQKNQRTIANNTDDIAYNGTKIANNKKDIQQNKTDIAANKNEITANAGKINNNTADITELKNVNSALGLDKTKPGITITPKNPAAGTSAVSLTERGLDNGGNQIHNVAAGTAGTDAVNVSQLKDEIAKNATKPVDGKNTTVTGTGTAADPYKVNVNDNLNLGEKGDNGIDGSIGVASKDGSAVTIKGKDGSIGMNGKDGKDGLTMKSAKGQDGVDGSNGANGMTRIVYEDDGHATHEVATMNDGMKYGGDVGNVINKKLNGQVNVVGGITDSSKLSTEDNIGVVSDGSDNLKVRLSKDLKGLDSVTTKTVTADTGNITTVNASTVNVGDTTITTGGMTIQNGSAGQDVTLNKDGLNNGGNKITNVAPGDISSTSTDAVNGSQLYGTETRINRLGNRINHVGAGAAALAGLHPLDFDPDDKWDFAAGYGNYKNANAVAIGAYYRPNEDTMFSVGGSFSGGENMVNVGVSWKFGQKSHISRSRVSMAKDMLAMKNQIETLTKKLAAYESGQPVKLAPIATGAMTFPDVPENHWAYEYVKNLAERGYLKGYPDGEFKGDRAMTRYEYAAIIYRALQNGAPSDGNMTRSVDDFGPELVKVQNIDRFRVDRISGKDNDRHKVERVRVNDKDDKAQNVYRDVYGNHIQK